MKNTLGLLILFLSSFVSAQTDFPLPSELSEISGLEKWNDSTLIAINDGGNEPILFLLNLSGQITRKINITNATNIDWEAIAMDENYLYIGDFGNNLNERKDLCIYRVNRSDIAILNEVTAEKMSISYREQKEFPPNNHDRYFDAEAMTYFEGQLWIFTKNSTKPFDGLSFIYMVQFESNQTKTLSKVTELKLNRTSYLKDAVTSACTQNNSMILTTYNRMIKLEFQKQGMTKSNLYFYPHIQQVESCVAIGPGTFFISNEKNNFLGPAKFTKLQLP
ncbi:MAG: hypothetical protein RLZZ585_806 [Bacteroidota bacterium]|jgi:hypothetical protein